jgi:hypothetical protein
MLDHGLYKFTIFKLITAHKHQRKNMYLCYNYICIVVGDPIIKKGRIVISLTVLTPLHFCVYPKPGPEFPMPYIVVFLVFNGFNC